MKKYISATAALMLAFLVCFVYFSRRTAESNASPADFCVEHQIAESQCPFCDKSLIEQLGMCVGHGVPEALCYQCNPALIPAFKAVGDWCKGHNRPESQCSICNPEIATPSSHEKGLSAAPADFCEEHQIAESQCPFCNESLIEQLGMCVGHGVPEALCYQCNPALIPAFQAVNDWCGEHKRPESQCSICNPDDALSPPDEKKVAAVPAELPLITLLPADDVIRSERAPSVVCDTETLRVQFGSAEIAKNAGFEYVRLQRLSVTQQTECNAETGYNRTRYASLSSRAPGIVHDVRKDLGRQVKTGEVLAVVDSADVAKAKADYLEAGTALDAAEKNYAREQRLFELNVAIEQELLEAEKEFSRSTIALASTHQALKNYGLTEAQIEQVSKEHDVSSLLAVKAPFAGRVVERQAVIGEVVDTAKPLFAIADTSSFWAMLDVPEADLKHIRLDQPVVLSLDGLPGENFGGRIIWVSSQIDPQARTLKAHAEIDNSSGRLRANMFGRAKVMVHDRQPEITVPKEAVQWDGCCNIVFVKKTDTLYEPRKVRLGYETEGFYIAESGLDADETVVTTGSFLLKTEIMKGSIGAGCCEVEPGK